MKKFVLFLLALIVNATLAIGQQMPNSEINKTISRSSHLQQAAGITNPDLIYPGQVVSYIITHKVQPGECQWSIVKNLKPVVRQDSVTTTPPVKPTPPVIPMEEEKDNGLWWPFLLMIALLVGIIFYVWRNSKRNPATAGAPRIPGGINSPNEARNQLIKTANEHTLPGSSVRALNLDAGLLSTRGNKKVPVRFGTSGKAKMLRFKNIDAFAADILVDGKMLGTGYVIQRCGNDAGTYMSGDDLIFVRQNGSSRPHVVPGAPASRLEDSDFAQITVKPVTHEKTEIQKVSEKLIDDDITVVSGDQALVADQFLQTQKAHKVTMVYERWADGRVKIESIFETKNLSNSKAGQKLSKKE